MSRLIQVFVGALACLIVASPAIAATRVLFVVDMSSSMSSSWDGSTRWSGLQDAITGALDSYGSDAEFGLMRWPGAAGGCAVGEVVVDIGPGNAAAIESWLTTASVSGGSFSPMGQTLVTAAQYSLLTDPAHHNVVIFLPDGYQYCSVEGGTRCVTQSDCDLMGVSSCPTCLPDSPDYCYCAQNWPVLGATALRDAGVYTYVVGIDGETSPLYLNQVAFEGGTATDGCDPQATTPSCYTQASTPAELDTAVATAVNQAIESAPHAAVPSITEWGVLALAMLLLTISWWFSRRRPLAR
jgi:hypothetical protein